MTYELAPFHSIPLDEPLLELLLEEHESLTLPRMKRLWSYYRNALSEPTVLGGSVGAPFQRVGLPGRLIEKQRLQRDDLAQREIVIENDIAWRIHTLVDFMFPAPPKIVSLAQNGSKRAEIEAILDEVISANGGNSLWQNAALLGAVYGHVDFLVATDGLSRLIKRSGNASEPASTNESPGSVPSNPAFWDLLERIGPAIVIETVEAPRAIPLLDNSDYRTLDVYILHYEQPINDIQRVTALQRLTRRIASRTHPFQQRASKTVTEIHSSTLVQRYEDHKLVAESTNRLGRLPVVHIQNLSQPFVYQGLSDVEPLIPLQDELNTRLSDRANRVTMQSFRMWLGKGIDGFTDRPVGPGQMWMTDNLDASIEGFGGDADSPSEKAHLEELREALDKASGVTPAAAGHIKARVGNLTSENALRISLMGTIAKVKRKRVTYGAGIRQLCELVLHALDVHGLYRTTPRDRRIDVIWTDPIAVDESRKITDALAKADDSMAPRLASPDSARSIFSARSRYFSFPVINAS
ncbi:MAG: phage portal protein, partial [Planctomycetota bacterium]|nr:phage portal protein [Planctomycetota bacterium]